VYGFVAGAAIHSSPLLIRVFVPLLKQQLLYSTKTLATI
jgi:hypothetical protein